MRLIFLLIGLVIIAFLINRQLTSNSPSNESGDLIGNQNITLPKVPVAPGNMKEFETDMNNYIQDAASQRNKKLEEASSK